MDTLSDYKKSVERARLKAMKLLKPMTELQMAEVAVACGVSFGLIAMYKSGKGTNFEMMLTIINAIDKK